MDLQSFKERAKNELNEIFSKIEELEAMKHSATLEMKSEYEDQLIKLKSKKAYLQAKYNNLVNTTDDKLQEAKEAFDEASDFFKKGFSKLSTMMK